MTKLCSVKKNPRDLVLFRAVQKISRDRDVTRESFAYIPLENVKMYLLERTDRQT